MLRYLGLTSGVVLLCAPIAAAQPSVDRGRRHFEAGTAAFDTGDYALAVTEFQASYELTHHPDILFNIYSAAERDGQYELALSSLERYLDEGTPDAERRAVLQQRLARLRQRMASPAQPARPDEPAPAPARPPRREPSAQSAPQGGGVHPAGVGVLIGAGVLGLAFAGLAIGSTLEADRLAGDCGADRSCTDDEVFTLSALNVAADVAWITAATAGVVGLVLLLALPPEGGGAREARVVPWIDPNGAGLGVMGWM